MATGSFTLVEELFAAGAAEFVPELRRCHSAERLGNFAAKWFADKRPIARQFLFDYLDQPLNCYRHEPLVKRLFKLAEKAGDDVLMGAFLVAFDRSIRRKRRTVTRWKQLQFDHRVKAEQTLNEWRQEGHWVDANIYQRGSKFVAMARQEVDQVQAPANTTMPRPAKAYQKKDIPLSNSLLAKYEKRFTLFSVATRRYLRRRTWRYFRRLGKDNPARYFSSTVTFLTRYRDEDIDSDIHLLDNWGLMNCLFRNSPALAFDARGVTIAPNHTLADLAPAPKYEATVWMPNPQAIFTLLHEALCTTVRQWAAVMLKKQPEWLAKLPIAELLKLIDSPHPEVAAIGFEYLDKASGIETVPVEDWLRRLENATLETLTQFCGFLKRKLDPALVSPDAALKLAMHRSMPVAELGFKIVQTQSSSIPIEDLLELTNAECENVRTDILNWLPQRMDEIGPLQPNWLTPWLDSKFPDARSAGLALMLRLMMDNLGATLDAAFLVKMAESPYDDVRFFLIDNPKLTARVEPDSLTALWAGVLTNIQRGQRQKPGVVAAIVGRVRKQPLEADTLLPLLAIAVRSLRGPEFRAGLAGLVQLVQAYPELQPRVREQFPELSLGG